MESTKDVESARKFIQQQITIVKAAEEMEYMKAMKAAESAQEIIKEEILRFVKKREDVLGETFFEKISLYFLSDIKIKETFDICSYLDHMKRRRTLEKITLKELLDIIKILEETEIEPEYFNLILEYFRDNYHYENIMIIIKYQINMYFLMMKHEPPFAKIYIPYLKIFIMNNYKFRKYFILRNLNHNEWIFPKVKYYKCLYYADIIIDLIKSNANIPFEIIRNMFNYKALKYNSLSVFKLSINTTSQTDKLYIVKEYFEYKKSFNQKYKQLQEEILKKIILPDKIIFLDTVEKKANRITEQIMARIKYSSMLKPMTQVRDFIYNVCMCKDVYADDIFSYIDKSIVFNNSELMFRLVKINPFMDWATFHSRRKQGEYLYKCIALGIINKHDYSKYIHHLMPSIKDIKRPFNKDRKIVVYKNDYEFPFYSYRVLTTFLIDSFKLMGKKEKLLALREYSEISKDFIDKIIKSYSSNSIYTTLLLSGMYKNPGSHLLMIQQLGEVKEKIMNFCRVVEF